MANIPITEVRGLFTKTLIQTLDIKPSPTLFLKSFFKTSTTAAKNVSVEVRRHGEPIAVDILRGTTGTMNRWDKSTEKITTPPYFDERFFVNELDGYDRIFADVQEVSADQMAMVVAEAAEKIQLLKDKINRRYELMAAQVLQTGIVTLVNGDNIDFKRSASSKGVLASGSRWDDTDVDPTVVLQEGANFVRQQGLYTGNAFNVIMGSAAFNAYVNNGVATERANLKDWKLSEINSPIQFGAGNAFLGRISAGSYNFNVWGYEQFYNPAGTDKTGKVPYVDPKNIIILPDVVNFNFAYAGVPQIRRSAGSAPAPEYIVYAPGEFVIDNYVDHRNMNHEYAVKSAGIAIPTQVDAVFTKQVLV